MKVTVVTNAFNQAKYLRAAVESVVSQDWKDIEYFLVNPGSKDDTASVIASLQADYPGRFQLLTEPDSGPADGLNKAFAKATGDLFVYLNGDDLFLPGAISAAVHAAQKAPNAAAIYGDGYLIDGEGKVIRRAISTGFSPWRFVYGGAFVLQQSTFYRAQAFRAVNGFNAKNTTSWDIEILIDMASQALSIKRTPGLWSVFRIHSESITGSQRLAEKSHLQHQKYFEMVTGKSSKSSIDRALGFVVKQTSRLLEPRATVLRIADAISPPTISEI